ncbi:LCP family protein [Adlercreutzia agrestimuris]|uniref:LCP family protein n=1 Tax=Adlercreutzia agrestimuris TaxID=2941324 RepID=UPI00203F5F36|nr:LCP family protein [Adlercreutzia agrestimuris]
MQKEDGIVKLCKKIALFVSAAMVALALTACASQSEAPEPTDVELMNNQAAPQEEDESDTAPFWVLLVGNDSRTGTVEIDKPEYSNGVGRSDTMMLVRLDPQTYQIGIVTIPRDTMCTYDDQTMKINDTYFWGGMPALLEQVELLTGVKPQYYLDMDFVEFENAINSIGGVNADVPIDMQLDDIVSGERIELSAGEQHLDGSQALVLARSRKQYADDLDACRQIQDRQIVENLIEQIASNPADAASACQALLDNMDTDWDATKMIDMVGNFASNADKITIISGTGPYAGGIDEGTQLWMTTRDEATWKEVIKAVDAGQEPTNIVPLPEVRPAS